MTRDEAVKKFADATNTTDSGYALDIVNGLAALGLLKFDEPKTVEDEAVNRVMALGWSVATASALVSTINRNGLKITRVL